MNWGSPNFRTPPYTSGWVFGWLSTDTVHMCIYIYMYIYIVYRFLIMRICIWLNAFNSYEYMSPCWTSSIQMREACIECKHYQPNKLAHDQCLVTGPSHWFGSLRTSGSLWEPQWKRPGISNMKILGGYPSVDPFAWAPGPNGPAEVSMQCLPPEHWNIPRNPELWPIQ